MRWLIAVMVALVLLAPVAQAQAPAQAHVTPARAQACVNDPSWIAPQAPFRIYGNTWYVGPHGLGVFLITAPAGDVLIDGGVPEDAPMIEANIRSLGFDPHHIKWILNSHAHCDHAGGIAQIARDTGAQVLAGAGDAALLARGGRDDPQYGDRFVFSPVHITRRVSDGERLQLGDILLTAHATPGHTKGNTSWIWISCEHKRCLHMVDVGSLSAPDYKLVGNPNAPHLIDDYEHSFATVAALTCDIALAPHPGMVDFWKRVAKRNAGDADALIDPTLCRAYANAAHRDFEAQLAKQRAAAVAAKLAQPSP
ncbi:MAG TPA: subclass B3 metallo-beta-lactamase [Rhodanobacteraceae bacterium]|nr:subclass B3 metallo-beta-lactamase [Rhodanobacteraceae bacterium]